MTASKLFRVAGFVQSLAVKAPVQVASLANLTLSGLQTVDTVALAEGDRILVKDQTDPIENGIYTVETSAWKRDGDWDGNRDAVGGTLVPAYRPSDGEIILYVTDGVPDPIDIGIDAVTFSIYNPLGGNVAVTGSFTATLTGYAANPTGTVNYIIVNGIVTLFMDGSPIQNTSNATTLAMTGLPAAVQPTALREVPSVGLNDGSNTFFLARVGSTDTISFFVSDVVGTFVEFDSNGFTASGIKGLQAVWTISYPL